MKKTESTESKDFFWSCRSLDDPENKYCKKYMSEGEFLLFAIPVVLGPYDLNRLTNFIDC